MSLKAAILGDRWWTPPSQAGQPDPFQLLLHAPTRRERMRFMAAIHGFGADAEKEGEVADLLLRSFVRDWANLVDEGGKPVVFLPLVDGLCPLENLERIPEQEAGEAAKEIWSSFRMGEGDRKNSSTAPGPTSAPA